MARAAGARASLHDLKLADLFDAAALLGYEAEGYCLGMQVENMSPAEYVVGLTPKVHAALPLLVEAVAAELARRGFPLSPKADAAAHAGAQSAGGRGWGRTDAVLLACALPPATMALCPVLRLRVRPRARTPRATARRRGR